MEEDALTEEEILEAFKLCNTNTDGKQEIDKKEFEDAMDLLVPSQGLELWSLMPPPPMSDRHSSPCVDRGTQSARRAPSTTRRSRNGS